MDIFISILLLVIAYLLGSIPWGFVLGKMKGIDIREHGSKNIGATNTGRVLGRRYAILAYVLDTIKGALIVALFHLNILSDQYCLLSPMLYGLAAILGHTFPIYLKFRGGKAVATGGGVLLAFSPIIYIACLAIFFVITYIFKYVSLGSIIAASSAFIASILFVLFSEHYDWYFPAGIFIAFAIIIIRHKSNIQRLLSHQESKVKWRKDKPKS